MTNTLVGGGIALFTALSIFLLQCYKDKQDRKNHLIDRVYDRRLDAYEELNIVLVEIYDLYNEVAVDVLDYKFTGKNYDQFDHRELLKMYKQTFEKNRLYFSHRLTKECQRVLFNSTGVVEYLPSIMEDGMIPESIIEYAQTVVNDLSICMGIIRKDLKIDDIEKIIR